MIRLRLIKEIVFVSCMLFFVSCIGCSTTHGGVYAGGPPLPPGPVVSSEPYHPGPPSHAPAHGYRAKHTYRYYPDVSVYFDIGRELYFYQEGRNWIMSARLPDRLRVNLGDRIMISMDSDKPYQYYAIHKEKYPPGKKKNKKNRWDH